MIKFRKILASALSTVIFTLLLSVHLTMASGEDSYTLSTEDNRYSWCELSDGTIKIRASGNASFSGELKIPSTLDGKKVTALADRGFIGQILLTKLVIPDSVTSIGDSAFSNCTSLETVTTGGKITDMGLYPFFYTPYEKKLEKKDDFVIFADDILYDYTGSSGNIIIPDGIRVISGTLFTYSEDNNNYKITSITVPDSVEYICSNAFYGCNNITTVTLGTGLKNIGQDAFTASDITIMGYYNTLAFNYATNQNYKFSPLVPYGELSSTVYADFSDNFRQYYFTDEKSFSREGVFVYKRKYTGEKIEVKDWEYSATPAELIK